MAKVLVTGGAGYIGSHALVELIQAGFEVVSIDNYLNSVPVTYQQVQSITGTSVPYYEVDLQDREATRSVFREHPDIDAVMHFAALKSVPDSMEHPIWCFQNNNQATLHVAEACLEFGVEYFIFSSSCSIYGNVTPDMLPVTEQTPWGQAESPYAYSKQNGEIMLEFATRTKPLRVNSLRYFNPTGAHISGLLGELPAKRVNNLVPVIAQAAAGVIDAFTVFGTDWNTRDGSCIRDYIHVTDIADAHVKALQYLMEGQQKDAFEVFNLGSGDGVSVLEAISAFREATGIEPPYQVGPRRHGDVEAIYTDPKKAEETLGWKPKYSLKDMMASAWKWQSTLEELGLAKHKL